MWDLKQKFPFRNKRVWRELMKAKRLLLLLMINMLMLCREGNQFPFSQALKKEWIWINFL